MSPAKSSGCAAGLEIVMNRFVLVSQISLSVVLLGLVSYASQPNKRAYGASSGQQSTWNKTAAESYVDGRTKWWLTWSGSARGQGTACISCHTSLPLALARPALGKELGETVSGPAETSEIADVDARVTSWSSIVTSTHWDQCVAYYTNQQPAALGTESVMNALVLVNHDTWRSHGVLSPTTRAALTYLWQQQQADGSWRWLEFGLRPWEGDGTYYGAALAAVAVGMAGKDYYDEPGIESNVQSLRTYLAANYASRPLHDQVAYLWASTYLPGLITADQEKALIAQLFATQDTDGGWSLSKLGVSATNPNGWGSGGMYPAGSISDGFATGLVDLALKRAGVSRSDTHLKEASAWLLSSESAGSWPANYINGSRDPLSDEGGFMRDAATSFAIMALAEPAKR